MKNNRYSIKYLNSNTIIYCTNMLTVLSINIITYDILHSNIQLISILNRINYQMLLIILVIICVPIKKFPCKNTCKLLDSTLNMN